MMKKRLEELQKLKSFTEGIDKDLTMILQTFQWDRKSLLQNPPLVTCKYDSNHKVPPDNAEEHEKECFLRQNGYSEDDQLLPDPLDLESCTLVKLKKEDIQQIITNASRSDPSFKKVYKKMIQRGEPPYLIYILGSGDAEPMSLERLQASYSADERRAIHDAVVSAAPSCHDLTDLAPLSGGDEKSSKVILSRQEILLELRNMRRRRTKYRVAAKSRNYSDVLRDVIRTQMEHYNDGKTEDTEPKETVDRDNSQRDTRNDRRHSRTASKDDKHRYDGKIVPQPIQIKIEREDSTERNYRDNNHRDNNRDKSDRAYRYETGSKDRRGRDDDRRGHDDRSISRRNEDVERSQRYGEHSRKRRHDKDSRERRYYYEESRDRRDDEPDREYRSDKRSRNDHSHKDYQVKIEPGLEEEQHDFREETSREKRHKDKRDKIHKHRDKKEKRRDRERSKERRRDNRHEERSSERIYIETEREDGAARDNTNNYEKEKPDRKQKSKSRRHDRSHRDGSFDSYYDGPSEEIYDPNKKIKKEK